MAVTCTSSFLETVLSGLRTNYLLWLIPLQAAVSLYGWLPDPVLTDLSMRWLVQSSGTMSIGFIVTRAIDVCRSLLDFILIVLLPN